MRDSCDISKDCLSKKKAVLGAHLENSYFLKMYLYSDRFQSDCVTHLSCEGSFQGPITETRAEGLMCGYAEAHLDPYASERSKYYARAVTAVGVLSNK